MKTKFRARDRAPDIFRKLEYQKLPFKIEEKNLNELGVSIAEDLGNILSSVGKTPSLKWCISTIKKAKVFILIYIANEEGRSIYKEEIAKKLPEYSYKTIATIIDEGIAKGYYINLDPVGKKSGDRKVKNIRPSFEVITAFYNWNIERICSVNNLIKKYK
jgi:hypothetical protein